MATRTRQTKRVNVGKLVQNIDRKKIFSEDYRLKTFHSWPSKSPLERTDLVKAGFYYIGIQDKVKCFSCKGEIENWEKEDNAMKAHGDLFPHCLFIKGIDTRNIERGKANYDDTDAYVPIDQSKITTESGRLETFKTWPKINPLQPDGFVKAGFYYVGFRDRVKCFMCEGQFEDWESGDDIMEEHEDFFPDCAFIKGTYGRNFSPDNVTEIDTGNQNRQHMDMVHESDRLDTFNTWPENHPVKPDELAEAGFFYSGSKDLVECFSCHGEIEDWEIGDTAMGEHERIFPDCPFVKITH